MLGFFIYICSMEIELIGRVRQSLINPKSTIGALNNLKSVYRELFKSELNINCGSCISDAILLINNWLKQNDSPVLGLNERVMNGEFELKRINLFVQIYKSDNLERQKELDICLKQNKRSGLFYQVIEIPNRLTFQEMFNLSTGHKDCVNIFANSDIFFDETILNTRFMDANTCVALSRWDINQDGTAILFDRKDSQDVWAFSGEVRKLSFADFTFGTKGCDNRIAYELKQAGYTVINPSKSIHAYHLHNTNIRTYTSNCPSIPEPYYFIHPHL